MNRDFWAGKKVFLTGHSGFKGTWLTLWLKELGARVTGYSLDFPSQPSLFELVGAHELCRHHQGDVRDADNLRVVLAESQSDIVLHLAAQPLVRDSYDRPIDTYSTNVMGTIHLLEACRRTPSVQSIVVVTTDKCYENREWVWGYRETDPLGGYDPYSSSKACAEIVTSSWRRSFFAHHGAQIATARAGNVIGGGDWARDRIIPDIIRAINGGNRPNIRNPHATRPWQHVLEPLAGYLELAERLWNRQDGIADAWNFGPFESDVKPVSWIADQVCRLYGGPSWSFEKLERKPHEAGALALDCSKARSCLNWKPKWTVEEAIRHTVDWYAAYRKDPASIRAFTVSQIRNYQH
jgi:CDP-glucose 4,6-dehydratase